MKWTAGKREKREKITKMEEVVSGLDEAHLNDDIVEIEPESDANDRDDIHSEFLVEVNGVEYLVKVPILPMNKSFAYRLMKLKADAAHMQYQMACYNTLGGAFHLCNFNMNALAVAKKQEILGLRLGSKSHVLRAQGYMAINIGLLGNYKLAMKVLKRLKLTAKREELSIIFDFLEASRMWLKSQIQQRSMESKGVILSSSS